MSSSVENKDASATGQEICKSIGMKKFTHLTLLLLVLSLVLPSCELIGDIFQAGLVVGIIVVIVVLALIVWILRKIF